VNLQIGGKRPVGFGRELILGIAMVLSLGSDLARAQTDGTANMSVTLLDYNGAGANHWTVVWVTSASGGFIKTLWKQGTHYAFNSAQWTTHTPQWNSARGGTSGSTLVDGYTSATATSYAGTNSPVILTWNCRDTNNAIVPDGDYKFWVQYAEDSGAGPYTTNGLLWTKGAAGATNNYPNLGGNFANMQVRWTPNVPVTVAPTITSLTLPSSGLVGAPYDFTVTATGTSPITFTASNLPTGLAMSGAGIISGIPSAAGDFSGTVTAANGTLPNAVQAFAIHVTLVPVVFDVPSLVGNQIRIGGAGPANGVYAVLRTGDLATPSWQSVATNRFDALGRFDFTNSLDPGSAQRFYRLRVP